MNDLISNIVLTHPIKGMLYCFQLINATCMAIGQGLGTACDTFFSQTFGSRNSKQIGVYLQRGGFNTIHRVTFLFVTHTRTHTHTCTHVHTYTSPKVDHFYVRMHVA